MIPQGKVQTEVGTVQNESNAVPVLGTCSKMYRGTGTFKKCIKVANKFFTAY